MADRDLTNKNPDYVRDIAHLLPAELTAFYISIKGIIPAGVAIDPANPNAITENATTLALLLGVAAALTLLFYFVMPVMLTISSRSQRVLYCVTFIIWVLGIEIDRLGILLEAKDIFGPTLTTVTRTIVNLSVAIWSFALPFVFRLINPGTITSTDVGFAAPDQIASTLDDLTIFRAGASISVNGSASNNGRYTVKSSSKTSISTNETTITQEAAGATVTIST